jgi:hypothetical protein
MIPRGASDIDPAVNAVQTMVARRRETSEALSRELGEVIRATGVPN